MLFEYMYFPIFSSGGNFVKLSGTICAVLEGGIIVNICVKSFYIRTSGSGEDVLLRKSLPMTDNMVAEDRS